MRKVRDFDPTTASSKELTNLMDQMDELGGFQGRKIATGEKIIRHMIKDEESLNFLAFPACLVATGIRGVLKAMIKQEWFDLVITTCGTLDHDLARIWGDYYKGSFELDDKRVKKEGYSRLGNVLVPDKIYKNQLEEKVQAFLQEISKKHESVATYELIKEFGDKVSSKDSILYWTSRNDIPVIVPGITDGMVGYQIWLFSQNTDFKVDVLKDESLLNEKIWDAQKSGAFIIGGGISKHHTIWWNQFKGGLDYAVYLSSAIEGDGSLSGARPKEAISWNKINEGADKVFIWGEASSILPLMISSLIERLKR